MIALDFYEPQVLALVVFASFVGLSSIVYIISVFSMKEKTYEEAIAEQRARLDKEQQHQRDQKQPKRRQVFTRKKKDKESNAVSPTTPPPSPNAAPPSSASPSISPQTSPSKASPPTRKPTPVVEEVIKPKVEQPVSAKPSPPAQQKAKSPKQAKQPKPPQQQQQPKESQEPRSTPQPKEPQPPKQAQLPKQPKQPQPKAKEVPEKEISTKKSPKSAPKSAPIQEAPMQKSSAAPTNASAPPPPPKSQAKSQPTAQKTSPKAASKQKRVEEIVQAREVPIVAQQAPETKAAPPPSGEPAPKKEQGKKAAAKGSSQPSKVVPKEKPGPSGETAVDTGALKAKNLSAMLKTASLSKKEVEQLVEVLLNKNGGSAANAAPENWVKANQRDPLPAMKKQLQEKEQALHNEMLSAQSSSQKVKELRSEISQDKAKWMQQEVRFKEKITNQGRECEAIKARMQQNHDAHTRETQNLQGRLKQLEGRNDSSNVEALKQLGDENGRLKAEAGRNAQRFQNEVQKMKSQMQSIENRQRQSEDQRRNAEAKVAQCEQQIKIYEAGQAGQRENETALSKRLTEVSEELRKTESHLSTTTRDSAKTKELLHSLTKENETVKKQLQEVYRLDNEKSTQMAAMEARTRDTEKQKNNLESAVSETRAKLSDAERQRAQKDIEIKGLRAAKTSVEAQLAAKIKELEEVIKPNGDVNTEPKEDTVLKKDHENIVNQKENELASLKEQVLSRDSNLESLRQQVDQQRLRNNEELEANLMKEQAQSKLYLQNIFPEIKVDASVKHEEWLSQFEKNALNHLAVQKAASGLQLTELSSKMSTLEEDKSQLVNQCQHYKSVLSDTEGILNKLQNSVESEEKKWHDKMSIKDTALAQAKKELQLVQEQLKQSKQASVESTRLASELEQTKLSLSQMEKERSVSATEYESTCRELKDVQNQLHRLMDELNTANQRVENSVDMEEMQKVKSCLADVLDKSKKTESELAESSKALVQLRAASQSRQDLLQEEIHSIKSSSNQLQLELAGAKENLESSSQRLSQVTSQLELAQMSLAESRSEVDSSKQSLVAAREQAEAALLEGKQAAETSLGAVREELDSSKKVLDEATERIATQQEELDSVKANLKKEKELTKEIGTAAAKLQAMLKKTQALLVVEKQTTAELKAKTGVTEEDTKTVAKPTANSGTAL